jgi:archaellum component FlaC
MESLKKEFLDLLEKDLEFRYAVAGYLGLLEILKRLDALSEEQLKLREDFNELRKEQTRLREDFNKILLEFKSFNIRLSRVERTLEKLTIDVEDEAKSIIKNKLKEIGISLDLTSLILPDLEINIYGASNDLCIIGEAAVRASSGIIDELLKKLEKLKSDYPEKLKKKVILVVYVSLPMIELIEKAKEKGIWVLKATEEFYKPKELFLQEKS